MRNVKINGRVAEDGSIILPPGVLESMCLNPGNLVTLEFAPTSPVKEANGYGPRFQVETGGCETDIIADEEEAALVVPHDLLNYAHIPMDTGLVVQTIPGAILIGDTDPMAAVQAPLLEILSLFGISEEEAYKAIEEGYRTFTMKHRYPFVCLDFKIDQELLDVNVHPTKMEIRFRNGREIYELVVDAVRAALLQRDLVQDVLRETPKKKELPKTKEVKKPEPFEVNRRKEEVQKVDQQGQGVQQQVEKQRQAVQQQIEKPSHPVKKTPTASESSKNTKKPTYAGLNYNTQKKEFPQYKTDELSSNQMTLREDPVFSVQARPDRKILGQLFKTYWLIEYEDQLFIMDQHAAHEKVNYERLMKNFKEKEIYSQRLEPPMVVTVSMTEAEALTRYKDAFAGLGFTIESFGGNEYCIREVPANLYGIGERDLFMELLDAVSQENGTLDTEVIASKIATMACKMSIKGNQRVSLMEVEHLLDELMKLENPYQCPHGRPTIIKMSKYEIDKKFKRIV